MAGRHRRHVSRWTRVRRALSGALAFSGHGRHRSRGQAAAELLALHREVIELRAASARLRAQLADAQAENKEAASEVAVARAQAEAARNGHRLALERLRAEVEANAEAAAAARSATTAGADLQISLLLPLVQAAMARSQAVAAAPELDAFPRADGLDELVAAEKPITASIDLRPGRHARVA